MNQLNRIARGLPFASEGLQVVFLKGRGALCADHDKAVELQRIVKGSRIVPLSLALNIEVLEFTVAYRGLKSVQWAKFWLTGGDKKAKALGNPVQVERIKSEGFKENLRAEFRNEGRGKRKAKRVKMVGGMYNHSLFGTSLPRT